MEGSLQIGRLFDIPVRLHWTFLIVIPLFAWIIGSQIELTADLLEGLTRTFAAVFGVPALALTIDRSIFTGSQVIPYILGAIVSIGLFVGVLIHELAHSLLAKRKGIKINSITLLILGGVSSMEENIPDPRVELPMALAGPLMSLVLGVISFGLMYGTSFFSVSPGFNGAWIFTWGYLGLLNVILFVFNLLPAFPMDGGRVLRAWLATKMPLSRATKIAADIGKGFAVFFGIFGFLVLNPILIIIAFFIYIGANQEFIQVKYNILLRDLRVADILSKPVITVSPSTPIKKVMELMYSTKHLGFPVIENDILIGMVTLSDIQKASSIDRDAMQVKDIMTRNPIILPQTAPVVDALRLMSRFNIGRIPVTDGNTLLGIITRADILKVMELRDV
ncbi:MAG: CBS domain-containing protein [Methanomicrobiales archaeon]|nr:CBS domain-containing protein [Methanomicrobiales archaeon]